MRLDVSVLSSFKKIDEAAVDVLLGKEISENKKKIVVLDDDPTGVQTVHDVSVYTGWDHDSVLAGFQEKNNLFYILTNSRGFTQEQTTKAHNEIASVVDKVAHETGREYIFISRSDSTLRGHYPLETKLLKDNYERNTGKKIDGEILCPFFKEGGRFTINNVHYVKYGSELVPANETEFAQDPTFGYKAATLPEYVEEKTAGEYKASDVTCISLEDIHNMDYDKIEAQLM
ncbi:MAG: hydroxyacid dehydrogenase, partial [Synergistaceae bacterium]|nr:hydroxyacid dehydrogenase [Synergistaceae bacterium]